MDAGQDRGAGVQRLGSRPASEERARRLSERIDLAREIHDRRDPAAVRRLARARRRRGALGAERASAAATSCSAALTELRSALRRPLGMPSARAWTARCARTSSAPPNGAPARVAVRLAARARDPARRSSALARAVLAEALRNADKHAHADRDRGRGGGRRGRRRSSSTSATTASRAAASRPDTGLGLRLVALEAMQHGGLVEFGPRRPRRLASVRFAAARCERRTTASERLRVLVVDDHDVVHWGFRLLLGEQPWVERCLSAPRRRGGLALARRYRPARRAGRPVRRRRVRAPRSARACCEASPDTSVLLISGAGPDLPTSRARAPARAGFVSKDLDARRRRQGGAHGRRRDDGVHARQRADPARRCRRASARCSTSSPRAPPTGEIGDRLFLSPHTVKEHTSALYRKLGVRNRAEAVQQAQRRGLLV